jgi:acyl carrier protein
MGDPRPRFDRLMTIRSQVRRFIEDELLEGTGAPGDPLEAGLLDSLAIEQLVAFLEERFGVRFSDEEVAADNFSSLGAVAETIRRKERA